LGNGLAPFDTVGRLALDVSGGDALMHHNTTNRTNAMTIVKHRPQGSLVTPFDELINGFFGRDLSHFMGSDDVFRGSARVNITEGKDHFKLELMAPGLEKDELKLNVENDTLTISAEKKQRTLEENERYTRREFGYSAFKRSFRLPENVMAEHITAEHANGILSVKLPKMEPSKPASREISIG
jgi:HSP20 family protein